MKLYKISKVTTVCHQINLAGGGGGDTGDGAVLRLRGGEVRGDVPGAVEQGDPSPGLPHLGMASALLRRDWGFPQRGLQGLAKRRNSKQRTGTGGQLDLCILSR